VFRQASSMTSPLPSSPARPLVLIVDGQQARLALYALALSSMGFDVLAADDTVSAFGQASAKIPDVIVTDLVLRRASGWDLLAQLKGERATRHIPVVILAATVPTTSARAMREGCAALLVQPCQPDRLALELRSLLIRQRPATVN
jgi:CheY-like chemotaxis protein